MTRSEELTVWFTSWMTINALVASGGWRLGRGQWGSVPGVAAAQVAGFVGGCLLAFLNGLVWGLVLNVSLPSPEVTQSLAFALGSGSASITVGCRARKRYGRDEEPPANRVEPHVDSQTTGSLPKGAEDGKITPNRVRDDPPSAP